MEKEIQSKIHKQYPFDEIEPKWRRYWAENDIYKTNLSRDDDKLYCLTMFIYPSGDKMHIGHWYNYGVTDSWARFKKLKGYNVFEPMGYDAFGLPAENFALKTGVHPAVSTKQNIDYIRQQLSTIGAMFDWSKELSTTDPEYYRWTQWIFIKLFEKGLAYRKTAPVNWCESCKTVLANEQVIDGHCERCDNEIIHRDLTQWFFKITDYADRLLAGHEKLDWPAKTIAMQQNWIGRSEGCEIIFREISTNTDIPVFTTRADTVFGVTYMVLAPEHPLVREITTPERKKDVDEYITFARKQSEIERTSTVKEKTGEFTGAYAENPLNGEKIPIWIADYVLLGYGTGAVMAVPGHDQRDFEFARKFDLPVREVIKPKNGEPAGDLSEAFTEYGEMINSGDYNGLTSEEGQKGIARYLESINRGEAKVNYRLRDWLISRQRYWGVPIPIVHCLNCGEVPVNEGNLPVLLPETDDFRPAGDGSSPLAKISDFVNTSCPKCGGDAKRETDTMDTFVDSTWYHLRYLDPKYDSGPFNPDLVDRWMPVDRYVGGSEHAVTHLMFARFINMFFYDIGMVKFEEPYPSLRHQGIITHQGAKMSKSRGNVVIPDDYIKIYGSDTFRMYMMFMGDYSEGGDWDDSGINGIHRFLGRVWRILEPHVNTLSHKEFPDFNKETLEGLDKDLYIQLNKTVKKFEEDFEAQKYNTAISAVMELVNSMYKSYEAGTATDVFYFAVKKLIWLLAPIAPHFAEELYHLAGFTGSIFETRFPDYDKDATIGDVITMVVQVNGKLRASLDVEIDIDQQAFEVLAMDNPSVQRHLEGKSIIKKIFISNKLLNIVVK
ncbi:MAG: leucine--tRNA ligase [candidate division Zixibacteria bacterium]|nr:leucine--tRNA ligase [candidate division Zixibacteria bacterium]